LLWIAAMSKAKQNATPADKRGNRTKRNPRDAEANKEENKQSTWSPIDDLYGDSDGAVDEEMEFDTGKYERPIPSKS
jgi:hypothetical protein